jgi:photosystem II stability/assembly factor-like uncharacterized protein
MNYTWRATMAPRQERHDDIWFISPLVGWAVNSAGQILHTEDGFQTTPPTVQHTADAGTYLRCMSFTSPTDGWVGAITNEQRLFKTEDGKTWTDMTSKLPALPELICGICSPSKGVVFASGTQNPWMDAAVMHTADGGETWNSIPMAAHANLLIDTYFTDNLTGWVVGGKGGISYPQLKPVIMHTTDGGKTWVDKLHNSGIDFPSGEWGWKIQFLTPQIGFVSLENMHAGAILKTTDGGETWKRIVITDPQGNIDLEGVGFIDEKTGWVGGWGDGFPRHPKGTTSGTTDGGATWFDANNVGHFLNRFRFFPGATTGIVGYASGDTIYQAKVASDAELQNARLSLSAVGERPLPVVWDKLDIAASVPANAKQLTITIFDTRQNLVKTIKETSPAAGERTFSWDFKTDYGKDAGIGQFIQRINIDGAATSTVVERPARATPEDLAAQVATMIQNIAGIAVRGHDRLMLPDASGTPVKLKSLFAKPPELMAALVRGGWIIPGAPSRSMFLVAIAGGTGPMAGILDDETIQLLRDWVTAGAVIPKAGG